MDDSLSFDDVFSFIKTNHFDSKIPYTISKNRLTLDGSLFFDRLLNVLDIKNGTNLYPARDRQALEILHKAIMSSNAPLHQKQSLIYYLLRDARAKYPECDKRFAQKYYLPERYRIFIDGIWYMDNLDFKKALLYLTHPTLLPTFPSQILHALLLHASSTDPLLPLAYYHNVHPPLTDVPHLLEDFISYLLIHTSLTSTFLFSRSLASSLHFPVFKQIIAYVHGDDVSGETRAQLATELINLPLLPDESKFFEQILEEMVENDVARAGDTLAMRHLACGDALKLVSGMGNELSGKRIDGLGWEELTIGLKRGIGPRREAEEYWASI